MDELTSTNCPVISVTEKDLRVSHSWVGGAGGGFGCLVIAVTENQVRLWSITLHGGEVLDAKSKAAIFHQLATRYMWLETKREKMDFLAELETKILPILKIESMHRKSLIRRLRSAVIEVQAKPRGRRATYNDFDKHHLKQVWSLSGYPCSKRLKGLLPEWLTFYDSSDAVKGALTAMSPTTMDEVLRLTRAQLKRRRNGGTRGQKFHIRKLIRLRDASERPKSPGFVETDTVVHCGDRMWGTFANSVTVTDLLSGWTDARVAMGKNAKSVVADLQTLDQGLPFDLKSLYFDNGIEYVNHLLVAEFKTNKGIDVARGRAGKKNDQCHVEQKNSTFVRELFGYARIESQEIVDLMNDLYANEWSQLHNYFMPQMKLVSKDRIGSKTRKKYDKPKTPYQRLLDCPDFPEERKQLLREKKAKLNPFELQASLQKKLAYIHKLIGEQNLEKDGTS